MKDKDRELREILGECGLDAPDEEEIQKAMGLIKALYKPLEKDEIKLAILRWAKEQEAIDKFGEITVMPIDDLDDIADAIINARGK